MKKLEEMKQKYQETEVPKEALEAMKKGIEKAKREERKESLIKFARNAGISVAAAFAVIVLMANTSSDIAHAMEKIPVIGDIARVVTFKNYTDSTKDFEASVDVPQIENAGDSEKLAQTNKVIGEYAESLIEQYEADLKATNGEGHYSMNSTYDVVRDSEDYLAIRIHTELLMAGSMQYTKVFNVDKETGEILALADFFKKDSDYIEVISQNIKDQMAKEMEEDDSKSYFLNSDVPEWDFKEIDAETDFYFDENDNLVIEFDKYEVAPGYMGAVSFTVKKSVIEDMLN